MLFILSGCIRSWHLLESLTESSFKIISISSIFSRIFKIGQAAANNAVDKLEDPKLLIDQAIRDKEEEIRKARKAVQGVIATEKHTKQKLQMELAAQADWEKKAEDAVSIGKDDLAVKALSRAEEHKLKADEYEKLHIPQVKECEDLKNAIRQMENQLAEYKRNKDVIIAQSEAAKVKKDINEVKARIKKGGADDLLNRLKNKAERQSAEADAAAEMANDVTGDDLEKDFADLEKTPSSDVQAKLEEMKKNLEK